MFRAITNPPFLRKYRLKYNKRQQEEKNFETSLHRHGIDVEMNCFTAYVAH